ncbi:GIY-YIG nuclease family protein [Patescibacteria group bacterium]|nr:GIY-YIG nuclease family protein [Patescibacteria group bacterium]
MIENQNHLGWYIGYSENISQRLKYHNSGKNISTKNQGLWKLIYFEAYLNKLDALGREKFLKSGSGRRFLKKQMSHYLER